MLRLLLGKDWTANRDAVLSRVGEDVKNRQGGRVLMVPELISHDMERRLCAAAGETASRYAEVLSFTRLARRVADSMGSAAQECLDNGGRVVTMASAARQLHSRLKAYASVETKPEFLTGLLDAVDEFKRCCISAEDLRGAAGQTEGGFAQKLEELSLLLEAYDSLCSQGKRDPRDQMTWLLEELEAGDYGENHVFYIDGFPDFTRQHMAILEHLIRVSPCVTVSLNCDSPESQSMAFEKAADTASQLLRCARKAGVQVEILRIPEKPSPLLPMRHALFQGKLQPVPGVQAIRTESPWAECEAAAERIAEKVRQGCRYRDIGVVCADPANYRDLVSLIFRRCGIPVYLSGNEDILQKSVVSAVLNAVDAALGGFEQQDVLAYLRSVISPLEQDVCDNVENYAILWGIRGNKWAQEWTAHPDGLGGRPDEASKERLLELNSAREHAVTPLLRLHKDMESAADVAQQVYAVYRFLEDIRLAQRLEQLSRQMDEAGDNRSAQILNQLWEILLSALEQLHDALGKTAWETDTFVRLLKLLLSQYDVGTIPPVLDAVTVGPVSAMRCQQVKHLFVLGAAEGNLPGYGGAAGVLTDQERTALREMGVPLTGGAMEGVQAEFAEIYGVFCGAQETVTVSYPSGQPSFVFRRLAEMAGGEEEVQPFLAGAMADPWEAGAYLARFGAGETARQLGVEQAYRQVTEQAGYTLGTISRENIRALYGSRLNMSASQVDKQAECRLRYFLQYGLYAKERKEATVDPMEFGSFVHGVLERTGRDVAAMGGFRAVSLEQTLEIAGKHAKDYAQERFGEMDSSRMEYLFRRNGQELNMIIEELWKELRACDFEPRDFEVYFGSGGAMEAIPIPSTGIAAFLRGYVDRVDTWRENGMDYFRVVDYKTGKKDFDYCDIFNGVGLQMLLYLYALGRAGHAVVGEHPIPAGVQYFSARVPVISADGRLTDEEAQAQRDKEWKRKGLLLEDEQVLQAMGGNRGAELADRERFKLLEQYVFHILGKLVDDIASGNVQPNPYTRGTTHNACTYCPYGPVCHPEGIDGRRNYKTINADRFWEDVRKEMDHG